MSRSWGVAAVVVVLAFGAAGCGAPAAVRVELASAEDRPQVRAATPEEKLKPRSVDYNHLQKGPRHPKRQVTYPYDMFSHCGIAYAEFGGRRWRVSNVRTDLRSRVAGTAGDRFNYTAGYMTLVSKNLAHFEAAGLPPLEFTPTKATPPPCD